MNKLISTIFLFSVCQVASAANWLQISESETMITKANTSSFDITADSSGNLAISVIMQFAEKNTRDVNYIKWQITQHDCQQGYGSVRWIRLNGEHLLDQDFVLNGDNLISNVSTVLCKVFDQ